MKYFIALLLIFSSTGVNAEWELVATNSADLYIDVGSIRKQGEFIAAWVLRNHHKSRPDSKGILYRSQKLLIFYQCQNFTSGIKSSTAYSGEMGTGDIVYTYTNQIYEITFDDVVPDSMGEASFKRACGLY